MKIVQAAFGVFHHFELARELERRGHLETIYSTWPWARLKREGLPHGKVQTFPWIHMPEFLLERAGLLPRRLGDEMGVLNALAFDEWTLRRIPECDALIALAGAALKTGRLVQQRGGQFICDRGSTHQRFQERIVSEEYRRWGVDLPVSDIRDTVREEKIYEQADAITVGSNFARRSFVEEGVAAEKVHVIPYGVQLEAFGRVAEAPPEGLRGSGEPAGFNVLFAGSVSLRKGVPYLLEAFQRLRHPAKRLRLVGALDASMKQLLHRLPLENVELLGPLPRSELARWMGQSQVLVLPSIEDGFGLVMAEAMACGCPVISSTNTGGEDLYSDGVEGFIVPIRDSGALADRMQRMADDTTLQRRMSAAALDRVQSIGGWTEYGEKWERLLLEITGGKQGVRSKE
jgi:glycosyltransferase involved in cell wall biosynthesis